MALGRELAGFDLGQVEMLRKAVAKKKQDVLAKVRDMFLAGVEKHGVIGIEQGKEVWSWIQASGRYAFPRAHACSYGLTGYECAYIKAHFEYLGEDNGEKTLRRVYLALWSSVIARFPDELEWSEAKSNLADFIGAQADLLRARGQGD